MLNVGNKRKELQEQKSSYGNGMAMLSMYDEPPVVEVSLEEFEQFAIDRLHVLKTMETYRMRTTNSKEQDLRFEKAMNKYLPLRGPTPTNPTRAENDVLKDRLSHFILRLAFCQTEDLRRWFLTHESALFRYRLDKLTRDEKLQFMKQNGIAYEQATSSEVDALHQQLKAVRDAWVIEKKERLLPLPTFSKVPFTEALDLVANRKVYLERGVAFVPFDHVVSILFARFRANLSKQLAGAFRKYNRSMISKDGRLAPVLSNLAKHHIGPDYSTQVTPLSSDQVVTPNMIDALSKTSMPLCMKSLHQALKIQHHLRHGGRMQYGLFLKGIGLQMDDAMAFWRQEFCKKLTVDDFNKKYAYNIRHNYGKEGKRKDYTPFNCMKIITGDPPKPGDYHGCPFRHYEEAHLRKSLRGVMSAQAQDEIVQLANNKHFQIACKKYFEATHLNAIGKANDVTAVKEELEMVMINHPNGYFEESRQFFAKHKVSSAESQQPAASGAAIATGTATGTATAAAATAATATASAPAPSSASTSTSTSTKPGVAVKAGC